MRQMTPALAARTGRSFDFAAIPQRIKVPSPDAVTSSSVRSPASSPGVTNAQTVSPPVLAGQATTAASMIFGCRKRHSSTSRLETFSPTLMMMSLARSLTST